MENTNEMKIIFDSRPENEGLARVAAAAFCTQLNPTLEEVADLKTAVSEAVTNCIIHAYEGQVQKIEIFCRREGQKLWVDVPRARPRRRHRAVAWQCRWGRRPFDCGASRQSRSQSRAAHAWPGPLDDAGLRCRWSNCPSA